MIVLVILWLIYKFFILNFVFVCLIWEGVWEYNFLVKVKLVLLVIFKVWVKLFVFIIVNIGLNIFFWVIVVFGDIFLNIIGLIK